MPPGEPRAAVLVRLPADARLYANQVLTAPGSAERQFVTPELEPGRDYHYVLRTEVSRDGRTVSEARRVVVRAGERLRVEFDDPGEPRLRPQRQQHPRQLGQLPRAELRRRPVLRLRHDLAAG